MGMRDKKKRKKIEKNGFRGLTKNPFCVIIGVRPGRGVNLQPAREGLIDG
jgi:hypothetical protein